MAFEQENGILEDFGRVAGVVFSYAVFLTVFYFIFRLTGRITETFTFWHVFAATIGIVFVAMLIKLSLK